MAKKLDSGIWVKILDNIIVAILYYSTARIGQMLAIPPGNISPVWIPSGIILAAMLLRGYHIWPGILIAAFIGNVWTYADYSSIDNLIKSILPGLANSTGDAVCTLVSTYFIMRFANVQSLFLNHRSISVFILFGAILGPFISALFGVTSLHLAGNVEAERFLYAFITWWTGDGVGVLILTPFFLIWHTEKRHKLRFTGLDVVIFIVLILGSLYILGYFPLSSEIRLPLFAIAPLLIWSVFRQDIRLTYTGILIVTGLSVIATASGLGPLESQELNVSLVNLQLLIAVITITMMYLQATVYEMQNLNTERGLLLKEVHHRVKNNLQVISGLLILQSRTSDDENLKDMFKDSQHRINSMSLVHEMLYKSEDLQNINMDSYLHNLTKYLADATLGDQHKVWISTYASGIELSMDTALPLGMMITEIITNSLKHGIELQSHDEIYVRIRRQNKREYRLDIGDNGKGMPTQFDPTESRTLGMRLIYSLAEQLNGEIDLNGSRKGTHYRLIFKEGSHR